MAENNLTIKRNMGLIYGGLMIAGLFLIGWPYSSTQGATEYTTIKKSYTAVSQPIADDYAVPNWNYASVGYLRSYYCLPNAVENSQNNVFFVANKYLDQDNILKLDDNSFEISIVSGTLDVSGIVTLKNLPDENINLGKGIAQVSGIRSYEILTYQDVDPEEAIFVKIVYNNDNGRDKEIRYFDSERGMWLGLKTEVDESTKTASAAIKSWQAKLAVFEDNNPTPEELAEAEAAHQRELAAAEEARAQAQAGGGQVDELAETKQGIASFYGARNPQGCAYLDYNKGDWLKVTDLATGKSINVFIEDRGPYVPGRVIDLSKESFSKLAPLSRGLLRVKVEKIDK